MSRAERAVKDMTKLYTAQVAAGAFALFFGAWLARNLPGAELSLWPICASLAALVQTLSCLGMGDLFMRLIPSWLQTNQREKTAALLRTGLAINALGALLLTVLLALSIQQIASLLHLEGEVDIEVLRLLTVAVLFTALYQNLERALYAVQEFGKIAAIRLVFSMLRSPLAVALYLVVGIKGAVWALCFVPFTATVMAMIWLWPYASVWGHPHQPQRVILQAIPFYGAALAQVATRRLDYLIVGALTEPTKLAAYYIARKLADYLAQLDTSAIEAITPKLAERRAEGKRKLQNTFSRCSRYLFLGCLPLHVGLAVTAGPIVALYAGGKYPAAGPIMSLLAIGLFISLFAQLYRVYVIVFANRWHLAVLDGTGGVASVALSAAFVLWLGGLGVALAQAVAYVAQTLLAIVLLRQVLTLRYDSEAVLAATLGSGLVAGSGIIVAALIPGPWSIPLVIGSGVSIYFLALTKKLNTNDMDLFRRVIPFRLLATTAGARFMRSMASWLCRPSVASTEAK